MGTARGHFQTTYFRPQKIPSRRSLKVSELPREQLPCHHWGPTRGSALDLRQPSLGGTPFKMRGQILNKHILANFGYAFHNATIKPKAVLRYSDSSRICKTFSSDPIMLQTASASTYSSHISCI